MLDWVIEGATVVDGTGAAPFTADVGVRDGRITEVGRIGTVARERIDGRGAWLTPGFVDIHTHYDGQATWDETFSPSIHHGVTTLLMGNCGVGFAPNVPGREGELIALMEGVEDIPGAALAEGVRFNWRSFGDYLDVLQAMPHSLDFLALVPHDPLAHGRDGRACAGTGGRHTGRHRRDARPVARRPAGRRRRLLDGPHRQPPHRARPGDTRVGSLGG
jgi:N-acyl-D-aspartate/D-glutamate deacylase